MSDTVRWLEVERLFHRALELPPEARSAFVEAECPDPATRDEVLSLLREDEPEEGWLEGLARRTSALADTLAVTPAALGPGRRIGPYRLEREIGRGGTSVVYLACRSDGAFERQVAIKVLARDSDDGAMSRRFQRELQVLSSLTHPNIGSLYDGGTTDDGFSYLVMEHVDGEPIHEYCRTRGLDVEARLRLFLDVLQAVIYAHRSLVIHRDLKPSNILVERDGTVKLLDFGVAKILAGDGPAVHDPAVTRLRDRWLTPEYAAPEQVRGERTTTATDVYQLGVVLYELLTDRHPLGDTASSQYLVERAVTEAEPRRPSQVRPDLSTDLEVIILTAMRKEVPLRYGSVESLAGDLRRFLDGRPIEARPPTLRYRARKFVRRNASQVVLAAVTVAALVGLTTLYTLGLARERDRARLAAATASEVSDFVIRLFEAGHPAEARGEPLTPSLLLERGLDRAEALRGQPAVHARLLGTVGRAYHALADHARADSLFDRTLAIRRDLYGPAHPEVGEALELIGWSRLVQADFPRAEARFREAIAVHEAGGEGTGQALGHSLHGLALALNGRARTEEGIRLLHRAVDILRANSAEPAPDLANAIADLAILYRAAGDSSTALAYANEGLALRRTLFDPDHPEIARSTQMLADLHFRRGDLDTAERFYRETLAIQARARGDDHPFTRTAAAGLAAVRAAR